MSKTYDAVIVGAGIIGASVAFQLAHGGLKVLVVDKGAGPASGATGKSSAHVSQTYAHEDFCQLASESLLLMRNWQDFTGLSDPLAGFRSTGCLHLTQANNPAIVDVQALHARVGIQSRVLDSRGLAQEYPDLHRGAETIDPDDPHEVRDHDLAGILELDAGFADPVGTVADYLAAARSQGAEIRFRHSFTAIEQQGGRIAGVRLHHAGGCEAIHTPLVVNCAGAWAGHLNRLAGVSLPLPLKNTRHQIVHIGFRGPLRGTLPVVRDRVNHQYFRMEPNGEELHLGSTHPHYANEIVADPDAYNEVADAPFREQQLALLQYRLPALTRRGHVTSYAGLYCHYTLDDNPIVDASPLQGLHWAIAFVEGFKSAPVVGMMAATQILGHPGRGRTSLPPDMYALNRKPRLRKLWDRQASPEVN